MDFGPGTKGIRTTKMLATAETISRCDAALNLRATAGPEQGAVGAVEYDIGLTNEGGENCLLRGVPRSVTGVLPDGRHVIVRVRAVMPGAGPVPPFPALPIPPGEQADLPLINNHTCEHPTYQHFTRLDITLADGQHSASARKVRDALVLAQIQRIHADPKIGRGVYGVRKVWAQWRRELARELVPQVVALGQVPRCQIERLMRAAGLRGAVRGKKFRVAS